MAVTYRKILVPLDGSELATQALGPAQLLAKQYGAEIILMRITPSVESRIEFTPDLQIENYGLREQERLVEEAGQALERWCEDLKIHGIRAHPVMGIGDAAEKIVDYVTEHGVDLVVMSTHGRTGLARWAYGSVARKVLDAVPCSVFLVRAVALQS